MGWSLLATSCLGCYHLSAELVQDTNQGQTIRMLVNCITSTISTNVPAFTGQFINPKWKTSSRGAIEDLIVRLHDEKAECSLSFICAVERGSKVWDK